MIRSDGLEVVSWDAASRSSTYCLDGQGGVLGVTSGKRDEGAAAVEFALVVPLLIALVLGIATFGRAYQVQAIISSAAREGARVMALTEDAGEARNAAVLSAPSVPITAGNVDVGPCSLAGGIEMTTVTVRFDFSMLGREIPLTGRAVMRCGG